MFDAPYDVLKWSHCVGRDKTPLILERPRIGPLYLSIVRFEKVKVNQDNLEKKRRDGKISCHLHIHIHNNPSLRYGTYNSFPAPRK